MLCVYCAMPERGAGTGVEAGQQARTTLDVPPLCRYMYDMHFAISGPTHASLLPGGRKRCAARPATLPTSWAPD